MTSGVNQKMTDNLMVLEKKVKDETDYQCCPNQDISHMPLYHIMPYWHKITGLGHPIRYSKGDSSLAGCPENP